MPDFFIQFGDYLLGVKQRINIHTFSVFVCHEIEQIYLITIYNVREIMRKMKKQKKIVMMSLIDT
jgi:hypothetical protein